MSELQPILEAIGTLPDEEIDIADAALQLARVDAPGADWRGARAHFSDIARGAAELARRAAFDRPSERANALAELLVGQFGYCGDTRGYDELANINMIRVSERRAGLPVALGVIWLHAAEAAGWGAHGVDAPAHFVIALTAPRAGRSQMVDVFAGGARIGFAGLQRKLREELGAEFKLTEAELTPMSRRKVLTRLQANIRLRRAQAGNIEGALACAQTTLLIAPEDPILWRETAKLQAKLEQLPAALESYAKYLDLSLTGESADRARQAIALLRTQWK